MNDQKNLGLQVKEVAEIKKEPSVALEKIKEIEEKEKQHGSTERSTKRKEELKVHILTHDKFLS